MTGANREVKVFYYDRSCRVMPPIEKEQRYTSCTRDLAFSVEDGILFILKLEIDCATKIAVFAPGEWIAAEVWQGE